MISYNNVRTEKIVVVVAVIIIVIIITKPSTGGTYNLETSEFPLTRRYLKRDRAAVYPGSCGKGSSFRESVRLNL